MTQAELRPEDLSFSTVINTSKEIIPAPDCSVDLTLETYLDALSYDAPFPRRRMLEHVLDRGAVAQIKLGIGPLLSSGPCPLRPSRTRLGLDLGNSP